MSVLDQATADQTYGCDHCGQPREAHVDEGACPGRGPYSRAVWREPLRWWNDDGHALGVEFNGYRLSPRLVCPESGCKPAFCSCQGEEYIERDPNPECPHCKGSGYDPAIPCWLRHAFAEWQDEIMEQTDWRATITFDGGPVPILWHGGWDDFRWRPRASASAPQRSEP